MSIVGIGKIDPRALLYGFGFLLRCTMDRKRKTTVKLLAELQVSLYQIILKYKFQSIRKTFGSIAIHFAHILKGMRKVEDI